MRLFEQIYPEDCMLNDTPYTGRVLSCVALLTLTIALDYWSGAKYSPLIFYILIILYISWNYTTQLAYIFIFYCLSGMTFSGLMDSHFFDEIEGILRRISAMVIVAILSYALIKLKSATYQLLIHQQNYAKEQQQRIERQREFVAALSHEIRTPLNIISGQSQRLMATKDTVTPDKIEERTLSIISSVKQIGRIVDAVLLVERIDSFQMSASFSVIDFEDAVRSSCQRLKESYQDSIINLAFSNAPPFIRADEHLISHVFDNLIANSIKYSPKPVHVDVVVTGDSEYAIFSVKDYGYGISKNELVHIFEKYYRGGNVKQAAGFGIGLFLVKSIVTIHSGLIEVESIEGHGSTLTVKLPRYSNLFALNEV